VTTSQHDSQPLTAQWDPTKMPDWKPRDGIDNNGGNGSLLEYATVNRARDDGSVDVFLSPGNLKVGFTYSLWDLCKANFVAWGPSCNSTDVAQDGDLGTACFGSHVQQWRT